MRILIVAMANSIHTARWALQFEGDKDKEIILFPSIVGGLKDDLRHWHRLYGPLFSTRQAGKRSAIVHFPIRTLNTAFHFVMDRLFGKKWRVQWLVWTIRRLKPDVIHTLEFQNAGYIALKAKRIIGKDFPVWIATNWGSDVYLYSQLKAHITPIKEILSQADFYSAECARDYTLAKNLGMTAECLPVVPNAGGLHLDDVAALRKRQIPHERNLLLVKGYQMVFGRAQTALRAIEKIAGDLKKKNVRVCVFLATEDVEIPAELLANKTGLDIEIITIKNYMAHEKVLELHAKARCYVGLSISDGISTSLLEAMSAGAFPIQTCTSCANEWIEDGVSGFIAPCDDEDTLGQLILRAMTDDDLVDRAAEINWKTISEKADFREIQTIARGFYDTAYAKKTTAGK